MYLCAIALSLTLTTITVTALPNHIAATNRLVRRENQVSADIGNLKLTFSNETITITETTTDEIIEKIAEACFIEGQCKPPTIAFHNIEIRPSGNYPTWIRNGLIDALRAGVKTVATCTEETNWRELYCADDLYVKCENTQVTTHQCTVPKYWGVNYQSPDVGGAAPPFIGADFSVKTDELS